MANYKTSTIGGTSYQRAREVHISNPLGGDKLVAFIEERVLNLADGSLSTIPVPGLQFLSEHFSADNAGTTFPVLDMEGNPTGSVASYQEVYALLQSLYYHLATQRDLQEQP